MPTFAFRLTVRPETAEDFLAASLINAIASRQEPGCTSFEVFRSADDPSVFLLEEGYVDEAALDAHRATEHFAAWRAATGDQVISGERFVPQG